MRLTNSDKITIRSLVEHSWRDEHGNYWHIDRMAARVPALFIRLVMRLQDLGYMETVYFKNDEVQTEGVTKFAFTEKGQAWVDKNFKQEPQTAATLQEFLDTYETVMDSRATQIRTHVMAFLETGHKSGMELVEHLRKEHGMKIPNIAEVRNIVDDMVTARDIGVHTTPGGQFVYGIKE
uniref:Uncharacterized protein n=1 Tax=Pseudomonas phage Cygsa01 TaxID=3138529 RepID=A0AAU6W494_9VIRU